MGQSVMQTQKRVLILGGTGRVGRALARVWPADMPAPIWQMRSGGDYPWDILTAQPPALPADVVGIIVLAGVTQGDDAALAANTHLALAACDLAAAAEVRTLLASSQAVYGTPDIAVSEDSPAAPQTPYGRAKYAMEQAVLAYENTTCLRIGNVAGCDGLLLAAGRGGTLSLDQFADGQGPRRAYIGPGILAQTLVGLMAHTGPLPNALNVAQPKSVAMADLLDAAHMPWQWRAAGVGALPALDLICDQLTCLVSIPNADPADLIAQARAAGWPEDAVQ